MVNNTAIISFSDKGTELAKLIKSELQDVEVFSTRDREGSVPISSVREFLSREFNNYKSIIFVGALGICVRSIAPFLNNKKTDPAIINIDAAASFVQAVVSGHIGGANDLCNKIARITGAVSVVSTQSDVCDLWSLDILHERYNWESESTGNMNDIISVYINQNPVALLLETRDRGTAFMESNKADFVDIFYDINDIDEDKYSLVIAVTPFIHSFKIPALYYRPKVLHVGVGCRKKCKEDGIYEHIINDMRDKGFSYKSIVTVSTIELKKDEIAIHHLAGKLGVGLNIFAQDELKDIEVPNPSEKVFEVTGSYGVAESCALKSAGNQELLIEKQKAKMSEGNDFTYAVAYDKIRERKGFVEIVGAGPGDPELVSVRGKRFLETADLILYAGSLVPEELTHYAKPGAVVRSSASMNLEEQFEIMKEFYDRGLFVVRLHTGDPCIYGAIQEQMAYFDEYNMNYHITPGISSFQAAAAELKSQFTIPEKVQSIILTRGEGRTPMPDKEKLHMLARSQSTMCIFLSASIVDQVQKDLLVHYPPTTPVAACYKLTWKEQKIFRGELKDLAKIIKDNNLTLTTMIIVGDAIDNRKGLSKLYSHKFKHMFRD